MKKIAIFAFPVLFFCLALLPHGVFAATESLSDVQTAATPVVTPTKVKDVTPLTAAEAKALTAKLNKEHNEKAFDKRFNAKAKVAAAKHAKIVQKKVTTKKVVAKKRK